jgi:hypothetical protein
MAQSQLKALQFSSLLLTMAMTKFSGLARAILQQIPIPINRITQKEWDLSIR